MTEPINEPDFDLWGNDRLLVLKSIPRSYFDDPHWYFVACRSSILRDMSNRTKPNSYINYAFEKPESELAMGSPGWSCEHSRSSAECHRDLQLELPLAHLSVGHQDHMTASND